MKRILIFLFFSSIGTSLFAQKIDSIFVNLYTDSLKKGTYNYINIDGKLSNGNYLPLDSTDIIFSCSDAKFYGNSLFIPMDFTKDRVNIHAVLRSDKSMSRNFTVFIKKNPDPPLKTEQQILDEMSTKKGKKRG